MTLRFRNRLFIAVAGSAIAAAGFLLQGQQGQGNPFIDHADNGETIHVLPPQAAIHSPHATQPTFAPAHRGTAVYAPSYGSGPLTYHGGLVMENPTYVAIYWNRSVADAPGTKATTIRAQIAGFANSF